MYKGLISSAIPVFVEGSFLFLLNFFKKQVTHSGSLSSSNLFLKYKTPVTPTAYSSVNHQKKKEFKQ